MIVNIFFFLLSLVPTDVIMLMKSNRAVVIPRMDVCQELCVFGKCLKEINDC